MDSDLKSHFPTKVGLSRIGSDMPVAYLLFTCIGHNISRFQTAGFHTFLSIKRNTPLSFGMKIDVTWYERQILHIMQKLKIFNANFLLSQTTEKQHGIHNNTQHTTQLQNTYIQYVLLLFASLIFFIIIITRLFLFFRVIKYIWRQNKNVTIPFLKELKQPLKISSLFTK